MANVLKCFYCGKVETSILSLISHIRSEAILPYKCSEQRCSGKIFGNIETFRTHLKKHFENRSFQLPQPQQNFEEMFFQDDRMEYNDQMDSTNFEITNQISKLRNEFLKIFLPIYSNEKIARKHAIENTQSLCQHFESSLELIQNSFLGLPMKPEDKNFINNLINDLKESVNIRSEYMLIKELERSNLYVCSRFIEIARKQQEIRTADNSVKIQDIIYGVSILPLHTAFYKLFNCSNLLKEILEYIEKVRNSTTMINYIQGWHWKKILERKEKDDEVLYLPLVIYFDDFEPNNPMSGHAGIHKLGGIYAKLLCLPPHLASKLWSVIVAMIFYTEDRKEFNNKTILEPLLKMLKDLENTGITLETPIGNIKKIKIITCLVIGDNLGLQQILSCKVGFNAFYTCRICTIFKTDRKRTSKEDICLLRRVEDYEDHVRNKSYGIEGFCEFNKLPSFHIYLNIYADEMHDILEGVCHYVFARVFHTFIHDKSRFNFKITDLNYRILVHNFGPGIHAKPILVPDNFMSAKKYEFKKLPFSASEMLTFTRNILLLLKGLIPECPELQLIRKLRNLISSCFAHSFQEETIRLLKQDIEDFLENYIELFGDIQPKFHNLLHYPLIISAIGPLQNISCESFEAAHQPLKKTAWSSNNHINLPVTLHKKVEIKFCTGLINSAIYLNKITCTKTRKILSDDLKNLYGFKGSVTHISYLYYDGLRVKKHCVVKVDNEEELEEEPAFVIIKLLVKDEEGYKAVVEQLNVFNFDTDICAFEVNYTNNFYTLNFNSNRINCNYSSVVTKVFSNYYVNWI